MAHPSFAGFDDRSLLHFFLAHSESAEFEVRRRAHLAWSVLCARHIERMRAYIVLFRRRNGHDDPTPDFDDGVLRVAVERALAAGTAFDGHTLRDFRTMVRRIAQRACADALAKGKR
ncbi:MAG: hypothetical protein WD844_01335 [Thermoleophilaceae bacterium]